MKVSSRSLYQSILQYGFSLIELVAIIFIVAVLAVTALPRFTSINTNLSQAKNIILTSLRHARQVALAQAENDVAISLVISSTQINLMEEGTSMTFPEIAYPINLSRGITVSQGTGILVFDTLGNTSALTIVLTDGTSNEVINVTGGGYAY